jgi:hypothetical protein
METYHDTNTLLPEERFAEAAKLLAQGFLRTTRGHRIEPDSAPVEESANICATVSYSLDGVRGQSVHATVNHENGE